MQNFQRNEVRSGGLTYLRQTTYLKHDYIALFFSKSSQQKLLSFETYHQKNQKKISAKKLSMFSFNWCLCRLGQSY